MKLNEEEKAELKKLAQSRQLQKDMNRVAERRHNPFIINGEVDIDRILTFLTAYNYFTNHTPKPFHKIIDKNMQL